jgi:DNA-binding MarR family transcriptional regulator
MSSELSELTTNELAVLESLQGAPEAVSQRELARRTGLSVGLINAVIKKLVHTGCVKTSQLNQRQLEYLLTPRGFAHTAMRSYHYIVDTTRRYRSMQTRLTEMVNGFVKEGVRDFYLYGDGDFAELVAVVFSEMKKVRLRRKLPTGKNSRAIVLNATPERVKERGLRIIDLVNELGNRDQGQI